MESVLLEFAPREFDNLISLRSVLTLFSHLQRKKPRGILSISIKILHAFLISSVCVECPADGRRCKWLFWDILTLIDFYPDDSYFTAYRHKLIHVCQYVEPQVVKLFRNSQLEIIIWIFRSFHKSGCKSKVFPVAINHIAAIQVRYHLFLARDSNGLISFKHRSLGAFNNNNQMRRVTQNRMEYNI